MTNDHIIPVIDFANTRKIHWHKQEVGRVKRAANFTIQCINAGFYSWSQHRLINFVDKLIKL